VGCGNGGQAGQPTSTRVCAAGATPRSSRPSRKASPDLRGQGCRPPCSLPHPSFEAFPSQRTFVEAPRIPRRNQLPKALPATPSQSTSRGLGIPVFAIAGRLRLQGPGRTRSQSCPRRPVRSLQRLLERSACESPVGSRLRQLSASHGERSGESRYPASYGPDCRPPAQGYGRRPPLSLDPRESRCRKEA